MLKFDLLLWRPLKFRGFFQKLFLLLKNRTRVLCDYLYTCIFLVAFKQLKDQELDRLSLQVDSYYFTFEFA